MATLEEAFNVVSNTFRISSLNAQQETGIRKIVEEGKDVLINFPTGFGKSLLCQALQQQQSLFTLFRHIKNGKTKKKL